jgi:hypothetical protein
MATQSNAHGSLLLCLSLAGALAIPREVAAAPPSPVRLSAFALPLESPAADSAAHRPAAPASPATGLGADKFQHASLSAAIGIGSGALTRSSAAALALPLALGLAKEWRDRRHTRFDPADLAADAVGALLAAAITSAMLRE